METQQLVVDPGKAREIWKDYQKHLHYSTPVDKEIMHTYQMLAQGRIVIKALESIRVAGLGEDKLPKLAIVRADAKTCWLTPNTNGSARMAMKRDTHSTETRTFIDFPPGTFPGISVDRWHPEAIVPLIPIKLRPRRALQNYHVLFEAVWEKRVPIDPMLLRRIGRGDLWTVLAHWDLTDVERAVLASRLNG